MMKTFTNYSIILISCFVIGSCKDDEVASPEKPTLTVNQTSGLVGETDFVFTINETRADNISLLPYGLPGGEAGILITDFTDGVATVTVHYTKPGTFQAIAVANNHSDDGAEIRNVQSDPISITVTSNAHALTEFSFDGLDTQTEIDEDAKTIEVMVPYGTDISNLKAMYTASDFSTVTVGGNEQTSGTTPNDFSGPVIYTVTADDGTSDDYTVTVNVAPIEIVNTIASVEALAVSESAEEKELAVSIDNDARTIVVYDTMGTPSTQFDSVRIAYELDGAFSKLKYGGSELEQDSLLNLTSAREFEVYSQDSASAGGIQTYKVYATSAPKLNLSFPDLNPDPAGNAQHSNFDINVSVLNGTDRQAIRTSTSVTAPPGVSVSAMKANGVSFSNGGMVDYSQPVPFELTVNDTNLGVTYKVIYTVTVTAIP